MIELRRDKPKEKLKTSRLISYIVVGIIFSFSLFLLIERMINPFGGFYLFSTRFDVVLTDSMSVRNEQYEDFLAETEQIQPMSLVTSEKLNDNTELDVYDVVLFNNPGIGTDMHRIVNVDDTGDYLMFNNSSITKFYDRDVICLYDLSSYIETKNLSFKSAEISILSGDYYDNFFNLFFSLDINTTVDITCEKLQENLYRTIINISRTTSAATRIKLSFNREMNYAKECNIEYINVDSKLGSFACKSNDLILDDESTTNYHVNFNPIYKYEIRGDKANTSDGWFTRNQIYAKVTSVTPRIGAYIRFFTSVYGIVAFTGIGILILVYDYIISKQKEKEEVHE